MKPVVLAVLLLLAVESIVSGDQTESSIASGDTQVASIVFGDTMEGGKSRYGDETCLPVILLTLQIYKIVSLLNYELGHEVRKNAGQTPGILVLALQEKVQVA